MGSKVRSIMSSRRVLMNLSLITFIMLMVSLMTPAIATTTVPVNQSEKVLVIASWVGAPITDVRFNMMAPQFWWDLGNELVYEKLAIFVRRNNTFIPWLAESWEWQGNQTFVIHLRHDVKWNDGHDFTARDVWTQIIIIKAAGWREYQDILDVYTPDDYTVQLVIKPGVFRLLEEYWILYNFPMALPYHLYGQWAEQLDQAMKTGDQETIDQVLSQIQKYNPDTPVGTGPYMLSSRSSAEAIFVKNPYYWRPSGQVFDKIRVIRAMSNDKMYTYYSAGTVDSGDAVMPRPTEQAILQKPWARIIKVPDSGAAIYFNTNSTYLRDVRVRKAIAYIIDRSQILGDWSNMFKPVQIPDGLSDWMRSDWLDEATINLLNRYDRDLDKARTLLEEAGFTYDDATGRWYTPDGQVFTIHLYAPSGYTDWRTFAENIMAQLQQFGIDVDFKATEDTTLWNQVWPSKTWDLIMNWWGPWNMVHPWVCHWQWVTRFESIGLPLVYNVTGYGELNATELWHELESSDPQTQRNAARLLSILVNDALPILPLAEKQIPVFLNTHEGLPNTNIKIQWPPDDDPLWYDASISRFETTLIMILLGKVHVTVIGTGEGGTQQPSQNQTTTGGNETTGGAGTGGGADYTPYIIAAVAVAVVAVAAIYFIKLRRR